ncbi:MAG: hypothetical protein JWN04_6015, partial [Myxococcaceae bacterium]|nr:hypothetical protein [Myxococcaceae bacterium]
AFVHSFGSTKGLDNGMPANYFP